MNDKEYKELSIKEFTKAAKVYETDKAGAVLASEPVTANEAPDDEAVNKCKALGASLV